MGLAGPAWWEPPARWLRCGPAQGARMRGLRLRYLCTEGTGLLVQWPGRNEVWHEGVEKRGWKRRDLGGRMDGHWCLTGGGKHGPVAGWEGDRECYFACVQSEVLSRSEGWYVGSSFLQMLVASWGPSPKLILE